MPDTTTAQWPTLTDGKKAKATEVEEKFSWLEGDQMPMVNGVKTTGAYDIGSFAYRWNNGYFNSVITGNIVTSATSTSEDLRVLTQAWGQFIGSAGTLPSSGIYNISSVSKLTTGVYRVNWDTAFSTNSYSIFVVPIALSAYMATTGNITLSSADVFFFNAAGAATDPTFFDVMALGE